jgi:DNA-binding transcriptional LysR family regulator
LVLTDAGRKTLAFAREQRERSEQFVNDVSGTAQAQSVVLAAGEGSLLYLLGGALRTFKNEGQGELRLLTRDREGALNAILVAEAHLAVTVTDEVPSSLIARKLARVGAAAVLPKGHVLARKHRLSVRDLLGEPIIAPAEGRPLRAALARVWRESGAAWAPAFEASGWEVMMRFAALGMGIAIVNDFCTPPPGAVRRSIAGLPSVQYQLLRSRQRPLTPAAEALEAAILASTRPTKTQ